MESDKAPKTRVNAPSPLDILLVAVALFAIGCIWFYLAIFLQLAKTSPFFSKNGNDFTHRYRYPTIATVVAKLPTKSVILDGELTVCDEDGNPDFSSLLMKRGSDLCVWVFDVLSHNGKVLRQLRLLERRNKLDQLMHRVSSPVIRQSKTFLDPYVHLKACAARKLEGIVSKHLNRSYVSGATTDWIKVKWVGWREENAWRQEFFDRRR